MKKIIALSMALALLLSLAGCRIEKDGEAETSVTSVTSAATAETSAETAAESRSLGARLAGTYFRGVPEADAYDTEAITIYDAHGALIIEHTLWLSGTDVRG